jgi:hypothetical protein
MKKYLLCAAITGAFATISLAQTVNTQPSIMPGSVAPEAGAAASPMAPMPSAEQRAADLQSAMEIRKWQAGPSSGDQASRLAGATDQMTPAEKRASDLKAQMEIRSWQTGPSLGDQAARVGAAPSQPPVPAMRLDTPEAQHAIEHESTQ